ncbi:MAG: MFS transporter [Candidatus Lokiarchaeota archaeon]|nr:MFS transporter [Candidatus Lokiarchaeota archaeon]
MLEKKKKKQNTRSVWYFKYLIIVLILVQILDNYTSFYNSVIPSKVVEELLAGYPDNIANSIFTICVAIASLGTYMAFLVWYAADKIGRRFLLVSTTFSLAIASIGILFSNNIVEYTIFFFLLNIFAASDMWLIYVNEEAPPQKKAFWTSIVLIGGSIGAILNPLFRSIYIYEESAVGSWRGMTYFAIFLAIPLAILILLTVKETSKYQEVKQNNYKVKERVHKFKENLKILFKSERRTPYSVILFIGFIWGLNAIYTSLGELFLTSSPYLTEENINLVITIMSLAIIIGYLITASMADKIGRKPLMIVYNTLFFVGTLTLIVGIQNSELALIMAIIGTSIMNISFWGLWVLISIVTIETIPTESRATGVGLKNLTKALGATIGLLIANIIVYFSSLAIVFLIYSILFLFNAPFIYKYLIETKGIDLSAVQ